jgi:anti-anti-sigma factor
MPVSFSIADSSDGPRKVVIWVGGELDADSASAVRARLAQAERHARSDVILDLTNVTAVDAAGLNAIVNGAMTLGGTGRLRVISPPDNVAKGLKDARLEQVLLMVPNRRANDRRERELPVAFDRRNGADRRVPLPDGA